MCLYPRFTYHQDDNPALLTHLYVIWCATLRLPVPIRTLVARAPVASARILPGCEHLGCRGYITVSRTVTARWVCCGRKRQISCLLPYSFFVLDVDVGCCLHWFTHSVHDALYYRAPADGYVRTVLGYRVYLPRCTFGRGTLFAATRWRIRCGHCNVCRAPLSVCALRALYSASLCYSANASTLASRLLSRLSFSLPLYD